MRAWVFDSHFDAAPFRMSLDARVYIGPDPETEGIIGFLTGDRRGQRPTQDEIKNRLAAQRSSPIDLVLGRRASLNLSEAQTAALIALRREYSSFRDSIYSVLAAFLVARNGNYRGEEVRKHWHDTVAADLRRLNRLWPRVREALSAQQYQQVPAWIKANWDQDPDAFEFSLRGPLELVR